MKKILYLLFTICVSFVLYADTQITILHTNDTHGQAHPFDYKNSFMDMKDVGGRARLASMVNTIRKETKNKVFLFDIGDISGRGEYASYYGEPEIKIMNYMKYDLMTLGNHEFKLDSCDKEQTPKGIDLLHKLIKGASFPCLCANVYNNKTGKREFTPYVILEEAGIKIAVVGMTSLKCRTYPETVNLTFTDPGEEWKKVLEEIKGKYDILVFASHLGDLPDNALARLYPEIDLVIEGDFHSFLFAPVRIKREGKYDCLLIQTGELGVMLGRLDLTVDDSRKIKDIKYKLMPVNDYYRDDINVVKILSKYKQKENFKPVVANWQTSKQ